MPQRPRRRLFLPRSRRRRSQSLLRKAVDAVVRPATWPAAVLAEAVLLAAPPPCRARVRTPA